jgi:hypothetical protein
MIPSFVHLEIQGKTKRAQPAGRALSRFTSIFSLSDLPLITGTFPASF